MVECELTVEVGVAADEVEVPVADDEGSIEEVAEADDSAVGVLVDVIDVSDVDVPDGYGSFLWGTDLLWWPPSMPRAPRMARTTAMIPRVVIPPIIHHNFPLLLYQGLSLGGTQMTSGGSSAVCCDSFVLKLPPMLARFAAPPFPPPLACASSSKPGFWLPLGTAPVLTTNSGGGLAQVSANW